MPIFIFLLWAGGTMNLAYQQDVREQKVNEICTQNYQDLNDVRQCKEILMRIEIPNRK